MRAVLIAAAMLAAGHAQAAKCDWSNPGAARVYPVAVERLLENYPGMDGGTKFRLMQKMKWVKPDDYAAISRDEITGKRANYDSLRDMHWRDPAVSDPAKQHKVCRGAVDRSKWSDSHREIALVYIETEPSGRQWVVMVPLKCNNVSLASIQTTPQKSVPPTAVIPGPSEPLEFDPPGAGTPADGEPAGGGGRLRLSMTPYWPTVSAPGETPPTYTEIPPELITPPNWTPAPPGVTYWPDLPRPAPPTDWGAGTPVTTHVPAIPEPETYALMLAGLGVVSWAARRAKAR